LVENLFSWAKTQTGQISCKPENLKVQQIIQEIMTKLLLLFPTTEFGMIEETLKKLFRID